MPGETIEPQTILEFWFGSVEERVVPSAYRAQLWLGDDESIDAAIRSEFSAVYEQAMSGHLSHWEETAQGDLALILLFDQFSRHLYRHYAKAYAADDRALSLVLNGLEQQRDHELSLIQRVFYYFPLLHAENPELQALSVQLYSNLVELALPETRLVYDSFFRFASYGHSVIERFGRFPRRNQLLGRESTAEEKAYLNEEESE